MNKFFTSRFSSYYGLLELKPLFQEMSGFSLLMFGKKDIENPSFCGELTNLSSRFLKHNIILSESSKSRIYRFFFYLQLV